MDITKEPLLFAFCSKNEDTRTRIREEGQLQSNISVASSCESSDSFHQEVEGLLSQSPTIHNWLGTMETSGSVWRGNELVSSSDMLMEQGISEFWRDSDYQGGFEALSQKQGLYENNWSQEDSLVNSTSNKKVTERHSSQMESLTDESKEDNFAQTGYENINISSIYMYMQQKDELTRLLDGDRSFEMERHSSRSQTSDTSHTGNLSCEANKNFIENHPWTTHDEYSHINSKAGFQWTGTDMMKGYFQSANKANGLNMARRKRKSKASPKDLLEQDASVLYKPSDWSQYDMSNYRMAALARYYYKKHRRNYEKTVRYECRKRLAVYRPRLFGRFIKTACNTSKCGETSQESSAT